MRIMLDMQSAQTESRFHGIGRYTVSLTQAIVRNKGKHEIIIALSDLFPETIESIRATFDNLLPQENIRIWSAPGPVREWQTENGARREAAELIREAFIASLQPDIVHIMSLCEGYSNDAITSIGRFDQSTPVSVTLYDLISWLNPEYYLKTNPTYQQHYLRKINYIKRASLLLTTSEASRQEGIDNLGLPSNIVVNISVAANEDFRPMELSLEESLWRSPSNSINSNSSGMSLRTWRYLLGEAIPLTVRRLPAAAPSEKSGLEKTAKKYQGVLDKFSITRPFLLYTGSFDEYKSLYGLIRAYAQLSSKLRKAHQLVFAGHMTENHFNQLRQEAKVAGLHSSDVIFVGYVNDDELVKLYNLSKLSVLPSVFDGVGLPALEAMRCGRAVIGANTSNMLEVIGREDALFDPGSEKGLTEKLKDILTDDNFRIELEQHGLKQAGKFSWDSCATKAITAFEHLYNEKKNQLPYTLWTAHRPKMAYVSPLLPEHTGIANYSAELLPELSRHYDVDVVVAQESVADSFVNAIIPIRNVKWFRSNAHCYDRVLYHFGNSPFHQHMFNLLEQIPGVVVLHDFFLSHALANMEIDGIMDGCWTDELYKSHGYKAIIDRFQAKNIAEVVFAYPCNLSVLQNAKGIITHSETSRNLASQWYRETAADSWTVIPSLTFPAKNADRQAARQRLNFNNDDFIICSFGMLGPTKLNHRLLDAYLTSELSKSKSCILAFVGENPGGELSEKLFEKIYRSKINDRIRITGWVDDNIMRNYLAAADVAVQLRALSRGETSRSVLECMSYGLPTIVNAHGTMVDLPDDGVWKLLDEFSNTQLVEALESLWRDPLHCRRLGDRAREIVKTHHSPRHCADSYTDMIERFYGEANTHIHALANAIGKIEMPTVLPGDLSTLAQHIARSISPSFSSRQLLVDVSALVHSDRKDGIHRVVRSILQEWLNNPPENFRVEPVYATPAQDYHYARRFTLEFLGCQIDHFVDEPIEYRNGDIFLGLDWHHHVNLTQRDFYQQLRRWGIRVEFLVYDLLPIQMPQYFPSGMAEMHSRWLKVVAENDGAICISKTVANELSIWMKTYDAKRLRPFRISSFCLGSNFDDSLLTKGLSDDSENVLQIFRVWPTFLIVGTIEPRKGLSQVLNAFEQLWQENVNINLVIVGREGWKDLPDEKRHSIPEIVNRLRHHPELGKRLFWLEGISDEYLKKVYETSTCLIAASEGEGFGLPLIEAAQHKLPIIARDIPIFREVAREYAYYFAKEKTEDFAAIIKAWLTLYKAGTYPRSDDLQWATWAQSAQQLTTILDPNLV